MVVFGIRVDLNWKMKCKLCKKQIKENPQISKFWVNDSIKTDYLCFKCNKELGKLVAI